MMAKAAADEGMLLVAEKGYGPWVFLFVNVGDIFQIDEKGAMGLLKKRSRQGIFQTIEGNGQDQDAGFRMNKRFFLVTFDEEDIIQRDVVDSFGSCDMAERRLRAVLVVCDGKCVHGILLFVLCGKVFLFSMAIFVIIS